MIQTCELLEVEGHSMHMKESTWEIVYSTHRSKLEECLHKGPKDQKLKTNDSVVLQ